MKVLFLTSVDHPQVRLEAEYLGRETDLTLTYVVVPTLNRKTLLHALKCFIKHLPQVSLALIKVRVPLLPQVLYYSLLLGIILEDRKVNRKKYDLIYAHWLYPAGFLGLMLSKIWKCKVISVIWGYDIQVVHEAKDYGVRGTNRIISRFVIEKSDLVIANHKVHKVLAQRISTSKVHNKILYIPPGIPDISLIVQEDLTIELKERLRSIPDKLEESKIVLYAPSLRPLYGIREFVRAAQIVSNSVKDCIFIIVGDGELKEEVVRFIRENKLEDRVVLMGKVGHESMRVLYKLSTLVCDLAYPGTGTTTLEALCFGKPVIGIRSPKSIIEHGKNGFLIEKGDYKSLANYIITLIKDPELRKSLSINARRTFVEHFNIERRVRKLLEIFKLLMNNKPGSHSHE